MAIELSESKLLPSFSTLQRESLKKIANQIEEQTINDIVADPTQLQIALDDLTDVVAPSPVANDSIRFDGTDWENYSPTDGYEPTISGESNITTLATDFVYNLVGNYVTVSGFFSVTPTAPGNVSFTATLPETSTATVSRFLGGSGCGEEGSSLYPVRISGVVGPPKGALFVMSNSGTNEIAANFSFSYTLLDL